MTHANGYANPETIVRVHVENMPAPARRDRNSTFGRAVLVANTPVMILGHAPNRVRALLTFVGVVADVIYVCGSQADAQALAGAPVNGVSSPIELRGSDEVWIISATTPTVGVIAEYCPA